MSEKEKTTAEVAISPETLEWVKTVKVGELVRRVFGGIVSIEMLVTAVDEDFIYCDDLKFSKKTTAEINEDQGWDENSTGALLEKA